MVDDNYAAGMNLRKLSHCCLLTLSLLILAADCGEEAQGEGGDGDGGAEERDGFDPKACKTRLQDCFMDNCCEGLTCDKQGESLGYCKGPADSGEGGEEPSAAGDAPAETEKKSEPPAKKEEPSKPPPTTAAAPESGEVVTAPPTREAESDPTASQTGGVAVSPQTGPIPTSAPGAAQRRNDAQSNQAKPAMEQLREAIVRAIANQQNMGEESGSQQNAAEKNVAETNVVKKNVAETNVPVVNVAEKKAAESASINANVNANVNANHLEASEPAERQEPSFPTPLDTEGLEDFVKAELERDTTTGHTEKEKRSEPELEPESESKREPESKPAATIDKKSLDDNVEKKEKREDEVRRNTVALDTPAVLPDFLNREDEMNGHVAQSVRVDEPASFADLERSAHSSGHQKRNDIESSPVSVGGQGALSSTSTGTTGNGGGLDFSSVAAAAKRTADEAAKTLEKIGSKDGENTPIKRNSVPQTPLIPRIAHIHLFGAANSHAPIARRGLRAITTNVSTTTEEVPVDNRDLGPQIEPRQDELQNTTPSFENSTESRTVENRDENATSETLEAAEIDDENSDAEAVERSAENDNSDLESEAETSQRSVQDNNSELETDADTYERSVEDDILELQSDPEESERSVEDDISYLDSDSSERSLKGDISDLKESDSPERSLEDGISDLESEASERSLEEANYQLQSDPEAAERSIESEASELDDSSEPETSVRAVLKDKVLEPETRELETSERLASNPSPSNLLSENKLNAEKISAAQVQSLAMPLVKRVGELMKNVENNSPSLRMQDALKSRISKKSEINIPVTQMNSPNSKAENEIERNLDSKYNDNNEGIERLTSDNVGSVQKNNNFDVYSDNLKMLSNKLNEFSERASELNKASKANQESERETSGSIAEQSPQSESRRNERDIDSNMLKSLLKKQSNNLFMRQVGPNKRQTILPRVLLNNNRRSNSNGLFS